MIPLIDKISFDIAEPDIYDDLLGRFIFLIKKEDIQPITGMTSCSCGAKMKKYESIVSSKYSATSLMLHYLKSHRSKITPEQIDLITRLSEKYNCKGVTLTPSPYLKKSKKNEQVISSDDFDNIIYQLDS